MNCCARKLQNRQYSKVCSCIPSEIFNTYLQMQFDQSSVLVEKCGPMWDYCSGKFLFSSCMSKLCKPVLWRQDSYVGLVIWKQMSRKQTSVFWLTVCTSVYAPYSFDLKSFAVTVFLLPSERQTSWCLCVCYCLYFLSILVWTVHVSLSALVIPRLSLRMRISI